jgi:hypothetical protein
LESKEERKSRSLTLPKAQGFGMTNAVQKKKPRPRPRRSFLRG